VKTGSRITTLSWEFESPTSCMALGSILTTLSLSFLKGKMEIIGVVPQRPYVTSLVPSLSLLGGGRTLKR
jgi:hypothetical protein